jgi:hypothetical protein
MQPETRRDSLTKIEASLAPEVPVAERRETLCDLSYTQRPGQDTVAAVIPMLVDTDDSLRSIAETLLTSWGSQSVSALLKALRSTDPLDVPYRLALIRQLARLGTEGARAETLLRSMTNDPNVGAAAQEAIEAIRRDFDDLVGHFAQWGIELLLLSLFVAAPLIAMRQANPKEVWPPLGIVIGFASLAVAGLLLARYLYAGDLLPSRQRDEVVQSNRWKIYIQFAFLAAAIGAGLGLFMNACGGPIQKLFGH